MKLSLLALLLVFHTAAAQAPSSISGTDIETIYNEHCEGPAGNATCKYNLVVTTGWMSSNGFSNVQNGSNRTVKVFNESYPGPTLVMTEEDEMQVEVNNTLSEPITVHWHGLWQPRTPWMDGVPGVTEVYVNPNDTFTYVFTVIGEHGTFWYHSHYKFQYADGLYGSLIVRHKPDDHKKFFPEENGKASIYTPSDVRVRDLQVLIAGLSTNNADDVVRDWNDKTLHLPDSVNTLVYGGKARLREGSDDDSGDLICNGTNVDDFMHYIVEPCPDNKPGGCGCRIRFANAGSVVPIQVSIQGHKGVVVEADGPFVTSNFTNKTEFVSMLVAQRYSLIYECFPPTDNESNYWIAAGALRGDGNYSDPPSARGCAILHYNASTPVELPKTHYNFSTPSACNKPFGENDCDSPCVNVDLNSNNKTLCMEKHPQEILQKGLPNKTCHVNVTVMNIGPTGKGTNFSLDISKHCTDDNVTLLTGGKYLDPAGETFTLCRDWQSKDVNGSFVDQDGLTNNLVLPYNHTIYVTLNTAEGLNGSRSVHPWHAHGYDISYHGSWNGSPADPPPGQPTRLTAIRRDTIPFWFSGSNRYSFVSDNPGAWISHCHIEGHLGNGFAMVFTTAKDRIPDSPPGSRCPAVVTTPSPPTPLPSPPTPLPSPPTPLPPPPTKAPTATSGNTIGSNKATVSVLLLSIIVLFANLVL